MKLNQQFIFMFLGILLGFAKNSSATLPYLSSQEPSRNAPAFFRYIFGEQDTYRIGDEWGKKAVSLPDLENSTEAFRRAALATAKVQGATAFFLGQFNDHWVMATNHHVFPRASSCLGTQVEFPLLKIRTKCVSFFGTWSDIDLSLFSIQLKNPQDGIALKAVAGNFAFRKDVFTGEDLMTIGFGVAGNSGRNLMAAQDSDCKVFSTTGEYRFLADPDSLNPGTYRAWSFANGCDVSHGDSGSAMVDRKTGEVMGIIWTGKIPKAAAVQSSAYLDKLIMTGGEEIWKELSYSVPAVKMREFLYNILSDPKMDENTRKTISDLLQ